MEPNVLSSSIWTAIIKYNLGDFKNRHLFLTVSEVRKSKIKALADMGSRKGLLTGSWTVIFSLCPYTVEEVRGLSKFSYKDTDPLRSIHPCDLIYFKRPVTYSKPFGFQHTNLRESQTIA